MREMEFREYLQNRGQGEAQIVNAVEAVQNFEGALKAEGKALESTTLQDLKGYLVLLVSQKENSPERLMALAS